MIDIQPRTREAYNLFHRGIQAFARAEQQGFRVDLEYIQRKKAHIVRRIERFEQKFKESDFFKEWQKSIKKPVNINSHKELKDFLYKVKGLHPPKNTASGSGSTDEESLKQLNIPDLNILLEKTRFKKPLDVLSGFEREQVDGYVHPFYNLHLVTSYRSCIAKGTPVLAVRDFIKYPKGVPIEEIKEGDYVYCFDDKLNPTISKVLWAGKTGHREVVRVHYTVIGRGKGFVDMTPEHKIRLIDGSYEQAQNLVGDYRKLTDSNRTQKIRSLSCSRHGDKLNFTGHLINNSGILEHRLIYEKLIGNLKEDDFVHHLNHNHLDHTPENLFIMTPSDHAKHHVKDTLNTEIARKNNRLAVQKAKNDGVYKQCARKGKDCPNYLNLSKFTCYRLLSQVGGQLVKVDYDFDTFKKYLKLYNINAKQVKLRYDRNGKYIWRSYLQKLAPLGRAKIIKILGINHYKVLDLCKLYNIQVNRNWANQFGKFVPGNHVITNIEWIGKKVDVYDIEVEDYHNFFANEICVHNSSDSPNFQNIPARDEEVMQLCRGALYPRPGHQLVEIDFKAIEVGVNACYNKDSNLIKYVSDPKTDMHGDMAKQLFMLDDFNKKIPSHDTLRKATKNSFVFPEFYGDYWKDCAENLACNWGKLPKGKWSRGQGIEIDTSAYTLSDHLISKGFSELGKVTRLMSGKYEVTGFYKHVKDIEQDFWENRFPEYAEWKNRWWSVYQKYGYFDLLTGFRCSGVMDKKQATNLPAQGSAFHCNLWTFNRLDETMVAEKWDTKLIGQIHDSIILDVNPDELKYIGELAHNISTKQLPAAWKWIIVPLESEMELCEVDQPWSEKKKFKL